MNSEMRQTYSWLKIFSTGTQLNMCEDLIRKLNAKESDQALSTWFAGSVQEHLDFDNRSESFLGNHKRTVLDHESKGTNQVTFLLQEAGTIFVRDHEHANSYQFQYLQREIAPLRQTASGKEYSGAGGIDYVGLANDKNPVLGEIKVGSDQNPFYALVQLLTYLSELATPNQLERANRFKLFAKDNIESPTPFDLHILLADFNDRGERGKLIEPARQLAVAFKLRLQQEYPQLAGWIGQILCLKLSTSEFEQSKHVECLWVA
jgi:hypothetical protein